MHRFRHPALAAALLLAVVGTHADGLPGEYVVSQKWRDLFAFYSPLSNPAFLLEQGYSSVRGVFSGSPEGAGRLWEMGFVKPIGFYHSVGFTWIAEDGGEIKQGGFGTDGRYRPGPGTMNNQNSLFTGTYALNPWKRLTMALNVNVVYQTNFDEPTIGAGADAGLTWRLTNHPILGYHLLGAAYQNLVPPKGGPESDDMGYSSQLRLTHHARLFGDRITSNLQFDITDFTAKPEDFMAGISPQIEWDIAYHLGIELLRLIRMFGLVGVNDVGLEYWGVAGGLAFPFVNQGRDAEVLYQYRTDVTGSDYASHSIYARMDFGRHREEIRARRMSRTAGFSPDKLYLKAMELFYKGKYWEAYFVFRTILVRHPEFFKNDWVRYYAGRCQEAMDMRSAALATYDRAVVRYPTSPMVDHANLGTMRVLYRKHDDMGVEQSFAKMNRPGVPDSLKHHAYYLMGESYLRTGQHRKAIQALEAVPMGHPEYPFAQHSLAVAHVHEVNLEEATNALVNCVEADAMSPEAREIQNRSYLFVGLIFYEKLSLNQAVAALRRVPSSSYYHEDALLGLGWCALKSRQWNDCMDVARQLQQKSSKPPLRAEGALLQAYAEMMLKRYDQARVTLEGAQNILKQFDPPAEEDLNMRKRDAENRRWNYNEIARSAEEMSSTEVTGKGMDRVIDSLHVHQVALHDSLQAYRKFVDEFGRLSLFSRRLQTIKDDIDYAYAIVDKMASGASARKEVQDMHKEQESLDEEIQRLENEMDQLEETGE